MVKQADHFKSGTKNTNALTEPHMNSNFADHLLIIEHTYSNIEHNMEILYTVPKSYKLNTTEQFEIYKYHKQNKSHILNDQIHFHTHSLIPYSKPKIIKQLLTPNHTISSPTPNHHKQPHSNIKIPRTLLVQSPYDATEDVQYQHKTAVSQELYVIMTIVKIIFTLYQKDGNISEQSYYLIKKTLKIYLSIMPCI